MFVSFSGRLLSRRASLLASTALAFGLVVDTGSALADTPAVATPNTPGGAAQQAQASPPPGQPVGAGADVTQSVRVDEIVVSARQRKEKALDIPIPLTALTGEGLQRADSVRLEDMQQQLPSTYVAVLNPRQNSVSIRGIGNNPANDGLESSTGIYIDGVYLGRPGMAIFDMTDLDHVELLRGPQGTLFGKNTTAGVLNIFTKLPSFTWGGTAEATFGNYGDQEYRASLTGPLIDDVLAFRLTLNHDHRDGFISDPVGGRYNGINREGGRLQFLYKPADDLTVRLNFDYNRESEPNVASLPYGITPQSYEKSALSPALNGLYYYYNLLAAHGYPIIPLPTNPYDRYTNFNGPQHISVQQGGVNGQVDWDFLDGYRLTSITAYRWWNFFPVNDTDSTNFSLSAGGVEDHDKQFSQEVRVASPTGGAIDWTAGLYYFWQGEHIYQYGWYDNNLPLFDLTYGPVLGGLLNNKRTALFGHLQTNSYAGFAQANWHATDDLTFTAGIRYTLEAKDMTLVRYQNHTIANPLVPQVDNVSVGPKTYAPAATLAAEYKLTDYTRLYTSVAHGEKAGATNDGPPSIPLKDFPAVVAPEKADDAEIGFKSELFDRKWRINGNLFYELIRNYQATSVFIDPNNPAFTGSYLTNVGAVRSRGAELESSLYLPYGFTLTGTGSFNNASYQSFHNGPCPVEDNPLGLATLTCNLTGDRVAGAPRWIAGATLNYTTSITDDILAYGIAEYSFKSGVYGFIDDSKYSWISGYGVTNLRAGVSLYDGKVDVSLWAKNVFSKNYIQSGQAALGRFTYTGVPGDPQTYGITLRYTY